MGQTDQYLLYKAIKTFNIIASTRANVNFFPFRKIDGRFVLSAGVENALIWDMRTGQQVLTLERKEHQITALRASPDGIHIAVGYEDGVVSIFDTYQGKNSLFTIKLHKSAITVLEYEQNGLRFISGGLDTDLTVVDMIEQAGKHRLIGHNAPVTDALFLQNLKMSNVAVSSSKDMQIKFWNLETQSCFKTIVDNRTEIWSIAQVDNLLVAGCSESTMNVYSIKTEAENEIVDSTAIIDDAATQNLLSVQKCGCIQRAGKGRTVNVVVDPSERVLICHGTDNLVELFYICTEEEMKKNRKKQKNKEGVNNAEEFTLQQKIKRLNSLKINYKIKSIDVLVSAENELRLLLSTDKNSLQLYGLKICKDMKNQELSLLTHLTKPGHQAELRCVCFSSDSLAIGSGAGDSFKLWNRETMQCLHTIKADYVLCCVFVPGDGHVLLGLKSGKLLIVDVGTGDITEEVAAHEKELWSIEILPDQQGCLTASSDSNVKHWTFEVVESDTFNQNISLLHKRSLLEEDAILNVCVSPDQKYVATSLMNSTVKIFFFDTFKYFLTLYGHSLPVMCMDISYDSQLIATGSADRSIKIWGMDFGDVHHSFFAHNDSVMSVKFIPKTHMLFSCGKDGKIKQWDADSFTKIITHPGHIGEAVDLVVSANGKYVVSCGSDRSLRLLERTDEIIVLSDVQEMEREVIDNEKAVGDGNESVPLLPGLNIASKKSVDSIVAVESLMECLKICMEYDTNNKSGEKFDLHPLMHALSAKDSNELLMKTILRIHAHDIEETLLLLPFDNSIDLLNRLVNLIQINKDYLELLSKFVLFLLKMHMKYITTNRSLKPLLENLLTILINNSNDLRDVFGYNMHLLYSFQNSIEMTSGGIYKEALQSARKNQKKRNAKRKTAIVSIS